MIIKKDLSLERGIRAVATEYCEEVDLKPIRSMFAGPPGSYKSMMDAASKEYKLEIISAKQLHSELVAWFKSTIFLILVHRSCYNARCWRQEKRILGIHLYLMLTDEQISTNIFTRLAISSWTISNRCNKQVSKASTRVKTPSFNGCEPEWTKKRARGKWKKNPTPQ